MRGSQVGCRGRLAKKWQVKYEVDGTVSDIEDVNHGVSQYCECDGPQRLGVVAGVFRFF